MILIFKIIIVALSFLTISPDVDKPDYELVKTCMGSGTNAFVVEYNSQFYVVYTGRQWIHRGSYISYIGGSGMGGWTTVEYYDTGGNSHSISGKVLSRYRFGYAGESGAVSICRGVARGRIKIY